MTIDKAWTLQQAIISALKTAMPDVEGFTYAPKSAPDRYWRADGFSVATLEEYKDNELASHSFTIHMIDAPSGGTNSMKWVRETLPVAVAALTDFRLDAESDTFRPQTSEARLENRPDGVTDAHAFVRMAARIRG